MKCTNCGRMGSPEDTFCGSCGKPLTPEDYRNGAEVDTRWLADALDSDGYTTEIREEAGTLPRVTAQHPTRSNLNLIIDIENRVINALTWWTMKGTRLTRSAMAEALNRTNQCAELCTFSIDDEGDLCVSFYIPLVAKISSGDVLRILHSTEVDSRRAIEVSGILPFMR